MESLLGFATALLLSSALIPLLMRCSSRLQLVDAPTEDRKIHTGAVPRVGGLGIVAASAASVIYWGWGDGGWGAILLGGAIIALFGYLDDRFGLTQCWKLFGQALAALVVMQGGVLIGVVPLCGIDAAPLWVSYPLTFLFIVGVVNAVNLSDGLDGLAAGTMLLSLGVVVLFAVRSGQQPEALLAAAVMGGLMGFLRYNTFPARIFMGDTGSQFLGFVIAVLSISVTQLASNPVSAVLPLFIVGLPIVDTLLVMCIRTVRGRPIFSADNSHVHYQLLRTGFRHHEVVAILYVLQAVFVSLAWALRYDSDASLLLLFGAMGIAFVSVIGLVRYRQWQFRPLSADGGERRNAWLRKLGWLHRQGSLMVEMALVLVFLVGALAYAGPAQPLGGMALACGGMALLAAIAAGRLGDWYTRAVAYLAAILVVYGVVLQQAEHPMIGSVFDGLLVVLVVFLALAVRVTRRDVFRLDNQDYLILFIVLILPVLPIGKVDRVSLGHLALRVAVLFYAVEYVISAGRGDRRVLPLAAVASMFLLAMVCYA